jgi:hypothetical protein
MCRSSFRHCNSGESVGIKIGKEGRPFTASRCRSDKECTPMLYFSRKTACVVCEHGAEMRLAHCFGAQSLGNTLDIMKNLCAVFGLLGTQFLLLHGRRCCSSHREYHLRCPRGSRAEGNPSETHALRPPLPQSWGWTRWTAVGAFPHAAFQTQPPRLRIQLQADTAAKASTRAAAEHLLKRSRMHTLANRRLKQLPHLTAMQSEIYR